MCRFSRRSHPLLSNWIGSTWAHQDGIWGEALCVDRRGGGVEGLLGSSSDDSIVPLVVILRPPFAAGFRLLGFGPRPLACGERWLSRPGT
jgi:hypothetical protein